MTKNILHETANLYLNSKMEVCLNGATHAVVVGKVETIDRAIKFMEKSERAIGNLRKMYQHY